MAVKLHRCGGMWVKIEAHPCWKVQKALDESGVEYEIVKHPSFPRSKRADYIKLTGTSLLPAIELEDGTVIRRESTELAEMIRSGKLQAGIGRRGAAVELIAAQSPRWALHALLHQLLRATPSFPHGARTGGGRRTRCEAGAGAGSAGSRATTSSWPRTARRRSTRSRSILPTP